MSRTRLIKKVNDPNFEFGVIREPLMTSFGQQAGYDAIIREDTHQCLSVVSPGYKLTTHSQANNFVTDLLDTNEIKFDTKKFGVSREGGLFQKELVLPELEFDLGSFSAVDSKGLKDGYLPRIIVQNSYDRSSSLNFILGVYRMVCSNGMVVGTTVKQLRIPHSIQPDFDKIGKTLVDAIAANVSSFKNKAAELEALKGKALNPYLQMLMMDVFSKKLAQKAVELSSGLVSLQYDNDGNIEGVTASKDVTGYFALQLVTDVVSNHVAKINQQVHLGNKIAKVFN